MKTKKVVNILALALLFGACACNPQQEGTGTTEMTGAQLVTHKDDQLMETYDYYKREATAALDEGYERGRDDDPHPGYAAMVKRILAEQTK